MYIDSAVARGTAAWNGLSSNLVAQLRERRGISVVRVASAESPADLSINWLSPEDVQKYLRVLEVRRVVRMVALS